MKIDFKIAITAICGLLVGSGLSGRIGIAPKQCALL